MLDSILDWETSGLNFCSTTISRTFKSATNSHTFENAFLDDLGNFKQNKISGIFKSTTISRTFECPTNSRTAEVQAHHQLIQFLCMCMK